jgi:hypothetical protein
MSLAIALAGAAGLTVLLVRDTLGTRYERDVSRMVFNDNTELLDELRRRAGVSSDSLSELRAAQPPMSAYIVVSIEDHRLWYKRGDSILFTAPVTTGSGKVLERIGADARWKFETPRGRLLVESKEPDPIWVPPDWHYVELAQARGLGIVRLARRQQLRAADGSVITVSGSDVVRIKGGAATPLAAGEDRELVVDGNLVIPPFGTNQRKYHGVLGTRRLNLGEGYAIHGTNRPELIGRSVSHGCVRLRNEDIETLYDMLETGTPVFIY